jgi:hypothetical protein
MKMRFLAATAALLSLGTGTAQAQLNDCEGHVDAAFQGQRTADQLSATPVDGVFWPPNHKLRTVTISAEETADNGEPCNVTITDARQDEVLDGEGDGNTSPDAANCSNAGNESRIDLRGERSGMGTGRFYTVTYTMQDPDAPLIPPKEGTATLLVPHDMGVAHFNTYVNEGPLYPSYSSATLSCAN